MAELAAGWAKTVTSVNLAHLTSLTSMDPVMDSLQQLKLSRPVCVPNLSCCRFFGGNNLAKINYLKRKTQSSHTKNLLCWKFHYIKL